MRHTLTVLLAVALTCVVVNAARAAAVTFSGTLFHESGLPAVNALVVAGTFKPGFQVNNYTCIYGDFVCNLNGNNYNEAVADGNFIPIASTFTSFNGTFSGAGLSTAIGSQIWLFGFPSTLPLPEPQPVQVLASGTDSSFFVPAVGNTAVIASLANTFELGMKFGNGLRLSGIPIPEPSAALLSTLAVASLLANHCRRR